MNVINKNISFKLRDLGLSNNSEFYYVKNRYSTTKLCIKTNKNNYLIVKGKSLSKIIYKNKELTISPAYTLSEINNFIKYYSKYFKVFYDVDKNGWVINKSIFKIYFLDYNKRKFIKYFDDLSKFTFDNEVDAKGELFYFLIISKFIDVEDFKT